MNYRKLDIENPNSLNKIKLVYKFKKRKKEEEINYVKYVRKYYCKPFIMDDPLHHWTLCPYN